MLTEKLKKLGLTQGEAKVYEALTIIGPSKVGPIIKRSNIAASNIYEVLNRLSEKGLVSHIIREKTKIFSALPPKRLGEFLERKKEELQQSEQAIKQLIPSLMQLEAEEKNKLDAEVFIGNSSLRTAYDILYEDLRKSKEARYFYAHDPSYSEYAYAFYRKEWPRMNFKNVKIRGIADKSFKRTEFQKNLPKQMDERYVKFPVPGMIDIINDKIMITTWGPKPVAILIHSKQVAENFKNYFESIWKIAKK
jgi:HTH-type transcriptional regulator, sugar sensing transcriptional regulator